MIRNLILCAFLLVAACGGNSNNAAPTNDPSTSGASPAPSTTTTTTVTTTTTATATAPATTATTTAAAPATTTTAAPSDTTTATTTATATATPDGKCGSVPSITATALAACLSDCDKLDDKVPPGAKCIPPRASCKSQCNTKFKK